MSIARIGMTEAKNTLADVVNRVAYGGEWIVLESRGRPKAAIVSISDLERLQRLETGDPQVVRARRMAALEMADAVRDRIRAERGAPPSQEDDSVAILNQLREERDLELADLR